MSVNSRKQVKPNWLFLGNGSLIYRWADIQHFVLYHRSTMQYTWTITLTQTAAGMFLNINYNWPEVIQLNFR